jgi:hypothetical protein
MNKKVLRLSNSLRFFGDFLLVGYNDLEIFNKMLNGELDSQIL